MPRTIMLIPTGTGVGLTSISLGLIRAIERKGVRLSIFKPVAQPRDSNDITDLTTAIVRTSSRLPVAEPLTIAHTESLLSQQKKRDFTGNYCCPLSRKHPPCRYRAG